MLLLCIVIFMDDDAICYAGAILRSISFLSHVTDKNVVLCYGLLSENTRYIQRDEENSLEMLIS